MIDPSYVMTPIYGGMIRTGEVQVNGALATNGMPCIGAPATESWRADDSQMARKRLAHGAWVTESLAHKRQVKGALATYIRRADDA